MINALENVKDLGMKKNSAKDISNTQSCFEDLEKIAYFRIVTLD